MATPSVPRREILEEAADWLLKIQAGSLVDEDAKAFKRWVSNSPEHSRAWQKVGKLAGKLNGLSPSVAIAALDRPDNPERRALVAKLVLLIAALPVGWTAWRYGPQLEMFSDYSTRVGELRTLNVADGSQIILNTDSAIDVTISGSQRLITLQSGEIHIETGKDQAARPFLVDTAEGRLRALGTRFTVRQLQGRTHLAVLEGAVEVTPEHGQALVVNARQQIDFSRLQVNNITPVDELQAAWTQGMLMADAMPLNRLIAQLERYRPGRLRLDPSISTLRVSGAYPLTDTDKALDMLARTYPVTINRALFGYLTTVSSK